MLHRLQPDESLLASLEQAWERMVLRRMYLTGGIGSLPGLEGFGGDYELDPDYAYAETCAALASLFWNWEMSLATGQARYSDLFEWQLYNAATVGMGRDGASYLYNNPLACQGGIERRPWFSVPCCPSNLSRTFASLGRYIFSFSASQVWVQQYIGSQASLPFDPPLTISIQSALPYSGEVDIRLDLPTPAEFTLHLRLPAWAEQGERAQVHCNGEPLSLPDLLQPQEQPAAGFDPRRSQYLSIRRRWLPGDVVSLHFDLPVRLHRAHPRLRGQQGKVALTRGPLVYCLERVDNPGLDLFNLQIAPATVGAEYRQDLFGGIYALRGQTQAGQVFTAVPYNLWANRGPSQMTVWINAG